MSSTHPLRERLALVLLLLLGSLAAQPAPAADVDRRDSTPTVRAAAPVPEGPWSAAPELPGYRAKVRFGAAGTAVDGRLEPECIEETACFSGAVAGRPEVFLRIVGPKPNGFLWPTVVKFSTSTVDVWIEQTATGVIRHYRLEGASPGFDLLPGLFDRTGFEPLAEAEAGALSLRELLRLAPRAAEPFSIAYDDGVNGFGLVYRDNVDYTGGYVARFDLPETPATIRGVSVCWSRDAGYSGGDSVEYDVVLYSYDELRGRPDELLARFPAEATDVPVSSDGARQGERCTFHRTPVAFETDSETIVAGLEYDPTAYPSPDGFSGFYIGVDTDGELRESWFASRGRWLAIHENGQFRSLGYKSLMVRLDGELEREDPEPPEEPPEPPPPPPEDPPPFGDAFSSELFPDFRFYVRVTAGSGAVQPVRLEAECIGETVCLSAALPGRSEIFLRVVGPKPNGKLWPTIVKFTTSEVEVWVEQLSTGIVKYYEIAGAAPGRDELNGLFDRDGFTP